MYSARFLRYPDMLEVGCQHGPGGAGDPGLSLVEARTHFGAWCIVSSPLILSHDMTNDTISDAVWPIIANAEAIAVNQAWAGESGNLFASFPAAIFDFMCAISDLPCWQVWIAITRLNFAWFWVSACLTESA